MMDWNMKRLCWVILCLLLIAPHIAAAATGTEAYRIAPGDLLSIHVFGEEDLSLDQARVGANGTLSFPLLGEIEASGVTARELEIRLTNMLRNGYLRKPTVSVSILEYRPFYVNGGVRSPGGYSYTEGMTVEKAVTLAGGFSESAARDEIMIQRAADLEQGAVPIALNARIQPGDVISIGEKELSSLQFFVRGEVKTPGAYEYRDGLTIEKAIALAGGFTSRASKRKINVTRDSDPDQRPKRERLTAPVEPGDIISVGQSIF